ncbi:hypothetical protein [Kitasatospora sp. HPMI-4]|uniref:hypothetical protein n=1 Tax=Kitasatospora sp. HPMI-4 TaxID=3448443 RepID=UPI003F1B4BB8
MRLRQAHAIIETANRLTEMAPDLEFELWPHAKDDPDGTPGLPDFISGVAQIGAADGATSLCTYDVTIEPGPADNEITVGLEASQDSHLGDDTVLVDLIATVFDPSWGYDSPFRPVGTLLAQVIIDAIRTREATRPR